MARFCGFPKTYCISIKWNKKCSVFLFKKIHINHKYCIMYTRQDLSRRSSLKSSILDYGPSRGESPGPPPTEDPLNVLTRKQSLGNTKDFYDM